MQIKKQYVIVFQWTALLSVFFLFYSITLSSFFFSIYQLFFLAAPFPLLAM